MSTAKLRRRMPSAKAPSQGYGFQPNRLMSSPQVSVSSSRTSASHKAKHYSGVTMSGEEADAILQTMAKEDDPSKTTWSRLFVKKILSKYDWYWPRRNDEKAPKLMTAWAYFEHVTLPRHFVGDQRADGVLRRAEPGEHEEPTELYSPFRTPSSTLIEWGTGVDLYFSSVIFFAVIMLIAGLINLPAITYYASTDYDANPNRIDDLAYKSLFGSAVCTDTEWVVCSNCDPDSKAQRWGSDKSRVAYDETTDTTFVLHHLCSGISAAPVFTNIATLFFLLFSVGLFSYYLRLREIRFDEDKITTTDYSVVVLNPPKEAIDPDKWKDFFSQFATGGDQVTVVTVALNNELLVRKLLNRRLLRNQLRFKLPAGTDLDDEKAVEAAVLEYNWEKEAEKPGCIARILGLVLIPILQIFNYFLPPAVLVEKIKKLTQEIKELQEKKYDASKIYVTFETEEGQRTALESLTVGRIDHLMNRTAAVHPSCLFEGKILRVIESTEPNGVRWLDLSYGMKTKLFRRFLTLATTVGMVGLAGLLVSMARQRFGARIAAYLTTTFNSTIPQVIKILMIFEPHNTEGGFQASLYLKITLFRWTLSGFLTQVITPSTSTLGNDALDLLPTIDAILFSEVWLTPLLRVSDWYTNIFKHILAPRSKTQEEMNGNFQGTFYNLGERYTDFTKILFVVFFYSALLPSGYFYGFVILTTQYWVDKFCLMRIWGWTPLIGSELAVLSRRFFFSGALIAFAVASSYNWAQLPYDNVCEPENPATATTGFYEEVSFLDKTMGDLTVTSNITYVFCDQTWRGYTGFPFPATPRLQTDNGKWLARASSDDLTWMTDDQDTLSFYYGWISVLIVILFAAGLLGKTIYSFMVSIFRGNYEPEGESQNIDFSSNPEIFGYVPQIKIVGQPFPYLVCDIDTIDQGLIGWNDASKSYDEYNLIFDVPHKSLRRTEKISENTRGVATIAETEEYENSLTQIEFNENEQNPSMRSIYSIIKHYPPKWQLELARKEAAMKKVEELTGLREKL